MGRKRYLAIVLLGCGALLTQPRHVPADNVISFDLTGTILDGSGKPVAGARVSIVSVGPRRGDSLASPWCYPECGRDAISDGEGRFEIREVDPVWLFTLFVESKAHHGRTVMVDPRSYEAIEIRLKSKGQEPDDSAFRVKGQVLAPGGAPAAGAEIQIAEYRMVGPPPSDAWDQGRVQMTDGKGRFTFDSDQPVSELSVVVRAAGAVPDQRFQLQPGAKGNTLRLIRGTTLRGRVLQNARPVGGVVVGATDQSVTLKHPPATVQATTDAEGYFVIEHALPEVEYCLFARMGSVADKNLVGFKRRFRSGAVDQSIGLAEVNLHPGHRLSGRVVLSDGKPLPADLRVVLARMNTDDKLETACDDQGAFQFQGVPAETVALSCRSIGQDYVRGYQLSSRNYSRDYLTGQTLSGRVDDDLDVLVFLEPAMRDSQPNFVHTRAAMQAALINGPNRMLTSQLWLEGEALRGAPRHLVDEIGLVRDTRERPIHDVERRTQ